MGDRAGHDVLSWVPPPDIFDRRNDSAQLAYAHPEVVCGRLADVYAEDRGKCQDDTERTQGRLQDGMADSAEDSQRDG